MAMGRRDSSTIFPHMKVGRYEFSRTKQIKYLGSIVTEKMKLTKKLQQELCQGISALMDSQKY